jgi:hypothetical protein
MGLFRGSKVDEIVSAERALTMAIVQHGKRSREAARAAERVEAARIGGSAAENIQASHEAATLDRSGREVTPRRRGGYSDLRS